jgi:hypothetical protein
MLLNILLSWLSPYIDEIMHLNILGNGNLVRQIMEGIHTMINREVKAPIKLDWRIEHDTDDSEITELGSTHAPPTLLRRQLM